MLIIFIKIGQMVAELLHLTVLKTSFNCHLDFSVCIFESS